MAPEKIRKTADPRDKDKMVRQLSLVAYLMAAGGRKVSADTIRRNVEGYGDEEQNFESFTRRFFADRDELKGIGIAIQSERDEFGDGDVYWLPRENFFLPQVQFSAAELTAINTCLQLLGGQFAYSRLLRLALQGLALGTGNHLEDPVTGRAAVNLLSSGYDHEVAARLARVETAISKRKSIIFDYHAMGRDTTEERHVDPYGLVVSHGDWYLVGFAHEREAVRVFKLKRIHGRIRHASKKEHDFSTPPDFAIRKYANAEPWQLGPARSSAVIRFTPLMGWWAGNNLSHCGTVTPAADGGAVLTTDFTDPHELCSLVLGLGEEAILEGPEELRAHIRSSLGAVARGHEGPPPNTEPPAARQPAASVPGNSGDAPQVEPEHFAQLARTVSYLVDRLAGREHAALPIAQVCDDLGLDRASLEKDIELLLLVNTGPGEYLIEAYADGDELKVSGWPEGELMKQPVRLTPREARAMILAIDLVGSQLLSGQFKSLDTAREKIIAAAGGLDETAIIPVGETEREDFAICRAINRGLNEHLLVEIEYLSQDSGLITRREVEPYLINRTKSRWYLVAWCRERQAIRTFRFEMIKSARLGEKFTPREIDLEPYLADPRLPSGTRGARTATVWFSPAIARWASELQPNTTLLEDGSLVSTIPFFSDRWLVEEILKYQGEAVLLSPEPLREHVAATAERLLKQYE